MIRRFFAWLDEQIDKDTANDIAVLQARIPLEIRAIEAMERELDAYSYVFQKHGVRAKAEYNEKNVCVSVSLLRREGQKVIDIANEWAAERLLDDSYREQVVQDLVQRFIAHKLPTPELPTLPALPPITHKTVAIPPRDGGR